MSTSALHSIFSKSKKDPTRAGREAHRGTVTDTSEEMITSSEFVCFSKSRVGFGRMVLRPAMQRSNARRLNLMRFLYSINVQACDSVLFPRRALASTVCVFRTDWLGEQPPPRLGFGYSTGFETEQGASRGPGCPRITTRGI